MCMCNTNICINNGLVYIKYMCVQATKSRERNLLRHVVSQQLTALVSED